MQVEKADAAIHNSMIKKFVKHAIAIAISCALMPLAVVAIGMDDWLGASRNPWFEVGFITVAAIFGIYALVTGEHKGYLLVPTLFVLLILALPFLELSPVKPAVRAIQEIRAGMTEVEVRAIIDRYFPEHGRFKRPEIGPVRDNVLSFVLDPSDGRYNAAVVQIKFSAGKCTAAEFLPD